MIPLRVGSLFSGVGGLDLGIEAALAPAVVLWQVELDPWRRDVLARRWPETKRHEDVRQVGARQLEQVDVVIGGFPCTGISTAGKGKGLADPRSGLWREYARIVGELAPPVVIIENSPALRSRGLAQVLEDLAARGYDAEWDCVPAGALGAPHRRDRIFIVAWRPGAGPRAYAPFLERFAHADGVLWHEQQRLAGGLAERIRDGGEAVAVDGGAIGDASDADAPRREGLGPVAAATPRGESGGRSSSRDAPDALPAGQHDGAGGEDDARRVERALGAAAEPRARRDAPDPARDGLDDAGPAPDGREEGRGADGSRADGSRADGLAADADGEPFDVAGQDVPLPEPARAGDDGRPADAAGERRDGEKQRSAESGRGEGAEPLGALADGLAADADGERRDVGAGGTPRGDSGAPLGGGGGRPAWTVRVFRALAGAGPPSAAAGRGAFGVQGPAVAGVRGVDDGLPAGAHGSAAEGSAVRAASVDEVGSSGPPAAQPEAARAAVAQDVAADADADADAAVDTWPAPARAAWEPQFVWPVRVLEERERRPREDRARIAAVGDAVVVPVAEHVGRVALWIIAREFARPEEK